ncbi:MAG: 23S rRNA (guanosine(2251)-2'-O)-methyltransferase RlmB [Candidatus Margulisiibacteriota bacterium]
MKEKLKLVKNLLEKRSARRKEGKFVVEGPHLVEEAGQRIEFIVYAERLPIVEKLIGLSVPAYKVSSKEFAALSEVDAPQGVLAVVRTFQSKLDELLKGAKTLIVYCAGIQDPGNLGTIIRSADALGATGVILSKGTVDLYNPKVVRSTMGSLFHLPLVTVEDDAETIKQLKKNNVKIIATSAEAEKSCSDTELKGPVAVLIGNEGAGLAEEIIELADEVIKVPMAGKAESLNASVTTAILLYEISRQRSGGL